MELHEKLSNIREQVGSILETANLDARSIIIGEKARIGDARPPSLWVFFEQSSIEHAGISIINETWKLQFIVAAVVQSHEPEDGLMQAEALAAKASSALLKNRTLNGSVSDIVRLRYLPAYRRGQGSEQLYGAGYLHEARFRHQETGGS